MKFPIIFTQSYLINNLVFIQSKVGHTLLGSIVRHRNTNPSCHLPANEVENFCIVLKLLQLIKESAPNQNQHQIMALHKAFGWG